MNSTTNPIGLTKREHYALLLAAGLMANPAYQDKSLYTLVDWAIDASDRLVEKLGDGPQSSDPLDYFQHFDPS